MRCSHCGTENSEANNFCGVCGEPLERERVPVYPLEAKRGKNGQTFVGEREPKPRREQTTISGPSFLGLTDDREVEDERDDDAATADYLLQDEHPHGHPGWVVFGAILVIARVA